MISACGILLVVHALAQEPTSDDDVLKKKPPQIQPAEDTLQKPMKFDPKKADGKEPDLEKLPRIEPIEPVEAPKQEDPQEILARVKKNMTASEERLEKKDVGDKTRAIQKDILRDLDALINRAEESQSSGGKSKPSLGGKSGQSGSQSQAQKKPGGSKQSGSNSSQSTAANSEGKEPGGKKQGEGKKDGEGNQPNGKKEGTGDSQQAKGGKGEGSGGGNAPEKKETNTVADLFKDVWGHLPAAKRMEMDAYSRERFMARYEDILREYYRTIAERNRRGGN